MDNVEKLMVKYPDISYKFEPEMPGKQKGLYIDNIVYLNPNQSKKELYCTVAEEIGHHLTTCGDIIDQDSIEKWQQEQRARDIGYMLAVPPKDIIDCYHERLEKVWECAEFLGVTEDTFTKAIKTYSKKYSQGLRYKNYSIRFRENGTVGVCDMKYNGVQPNKELSDQISDELLKVSGHKFTIE